MQLIVTVCEVREVCSEALQALTSAPNQNIVRGCCYELAVLVANFVDVESHLTIEILGSLILDIDGNILVSCLLIVLLAHLFRNSDRFIVARAWL